MYLGEILVLVGFFGVAVALGLIGYLIGSRKNSRLYKKILDQETLDFAAFSTTMTQGRLKGQNSAAQGSSHIFSSSIHHSSSHFPQVDDTEPMDNVIEETLPLMAGNTFGLMTDVSGNTADLNLDWSVLAGQYKFLEKVADGGMSQVFKALKISTGNEWIVKFIPKKLGGIVQEAEILKRLKHMSLPSIIDVFESEEGQFLVETFIEGVGMDVVLKDRGAIPFFPMLEWTEQLVQVLEYLHKEESILHLDLKPSNIMVTRNDKLVLIDFGISRQQSEVAGAAAATLSYAAPEQLKRAARGKKKEIIERRFGRLPEDWQDWQLDARTDIYSLGVIMFVMATGKAPLYDNINLLKRAVPNGLYRIISKCLQTRPQNRYQSTSELLFDITTLKAHSKNQLLAFMRVKRVASAGLAAAMGIAAFGFFMGSHLINLEAMTIMTVDPPILTVSVQQSTEVRLERLLEDTGAERPFNPNNLVWEIEANEIAQVDGNRIIGLNVGETQVNGIYRQNIVTMQVEVVEPMNGIVEISQRYMAGGLISVLGGTTQRDWIDGSLAAAEFVGPGSLDITANGAVYFADSGILRRIFNGQVETIEINPSFLRTNIVRTYGNDVFALTDAWNEDGEFFYGIFRIHDPDGTNTGAEGIFLGDASNTDIRDFFVHDGLLYFIEWNAAGGQAYLRTLDISGDYFPTTIAELPNGVTAMTMGDGVIFLADREQGIILAYELTNVGISASLRQIAGAAGERAFIDGAAPLFYQPSRLRYYNNELFVWDFNVLRKLTFSEESGAVEGAITLVGRASPVYDLGVRFTEQAAHEIILPFSELMDFVVVGEVVILTDPKRGRVWEFLT